MSFFNDDPFDEILKEFFGNNSGTKKYKERLMKTEEDERIIDYSEDEDYVYFIFELPGYSEEDIEVLIKNNSININANKKNSDIVQTYLNKKLTKGINISKKLPDYIKTKNFDKSVKNGVLELKFKKK